MKPFLNSSVKAAFIVWGPPSHGPRSKVLARELGISALHYVYSNTRRGLVSALYRYSAQAVETFRILRRERAQVVFVQSPPSFAVLCVFAYARTSRTHFVVDAHSAAFQYWFWMWPRWLFRLLVRNAVTTIVTNPRFETIVREAGGDALVVRDIPTSFERVGEYALTGDFNIAVVNTFAPDEPLTEILGAAAELSDVHFYVTGKLANAPPPLVERAPANVHFTDFLSDVEYYGLLASADAVMCLTTRDNTMQRGACEALSLGKPIITSNWGLLRDYFRQGTVHVENTANDIRRGVIALRSDYPRYETEILALQDAQQNEWQEKRECLITRIEASLNGSTLREPLARANAGEVS